jgi:hypothetical protein
MTYMVTLEFTPTNEHTTNTTMNQPTNTSSRLFYALWAAALCGSGVSYGRVYAFHILLIINVLYCIWSFSIRIYQSQIPNPESQIPNPKSPIPNLQSQIPNLQSPNPKFLHYFWLILPVCFLVEMTYCVDKMAALQHFVILSFGVSLFWLTILNLKTAQHFKRISQITAVVGGLNIAIGAAEAVGLWRYPIGSLSQINETFGYTGVFWDEILGAFHGSLIQPSASLNYHATLLGAFERISHIPTAMFWNPNNFALFLLLLLPFLIFSKHKTAFWLGIPIVFLFFVLTGARLVFISAALGVFSFVFINFFYKITDLGFKKIFFILFFPVFIATNGFGLAGKYFWQSNEMAFFYKKTSDVLPKNDIATSSVNVRKALLEAGIVTLKKNYGIGIGGGNMSVLLQKKGGIGARKITVLHNFWLELAVEGGVFLAILFVAWYFILIKTLFLQQYKYDLWAKIYVLPTLFALLILPIAGIAPSGLLYFLPMYALFGWAVALCRAQ